jgi:hypothetical protein
MLAWLPLLLFHHHRQCAHSFWMDYMVKPLIDVAAALMAEVRRSEGLLAAAATSSPGASSLSLS